MNPTLQKLLKPLASLRITVTLLVITCLLVLAGTTAQRDMGIQDVQHQFFHSWIAKIQFHYFQPTPKAGSAYLPGWFPLPGGFLLIVLLLVNLLSAHTLRFKFSSKRIGIILIHLGLILLLTGEWVTAHRAVESVMTINEGSTANHTADIRFTELAVIDGSPSDHDNVTVIDGAALAKAAGGELIHDARLPFDVKVERWYDNSWIVGPQQKSAKIERLANAGPNQIFGLERLRKANGTQSGTDFPAAFVTLQKNGQSMGTYLVSAMLDKEFDPLNLPTANDSPQAVTVDGKTYRVALRFRREYKPYSITLNKFTHAVYSGTDMARDFASDIRLVDPSRHVDRNVRIWMNHPLRFAGDTIYQQSFKNSDHTTVLQVVRNPADSLPYIACVIGGLGLVIHFGTKLIEFLNRRLAPTAGTVGAIQPRGRGKTKSRSRKGSESDRYTLEPQPLWKTWGVPLAFTLVYLIWIVARLFKSDPQTNGYNWAGLGALPIQFEGRVQPIDSLARNSLSIIGGKQKVRDEKGETLSDVSPTQWLFETMTASGKWKEYKIIRIDFPEIKQQLGLKETEKYFSWDDIIAKEDNGRLIQEQTTRALEVAAEDRDAYQHSMVDLGERLRLMVRFHQVIEIAEVYTLLQDKDHADSMYEQIISAISSIDPTLMDKVRKGDDEGVRQAMSDGLARLDMKSLPAEQRQAIMQYIHAQNLVRAFREMPMTQKLMLAAPLKPGEEWTALSDAVIGQRQISESAGAIVSIVRDYVSQRPADFNADIAAYQSKLDSAMPAATTAVSFENFFNHFDPFVICAYLYVAIFLKAIWSWMGWSVPLSRAAFLTMIFTFVIHTFGIISRIYISGRPPVTNLYSASVFIGWAVILFCIGLEAIYRNSVAMVAGATIGFVTMLVADGLAAVEGDTMKKLQAVLDTNGWLATHVVCEALGYMATILAGVLAIIYILRGVFSPSLTKEELKENARMTYGILGFAILFSFVGTILGGIWADQSWGRFWGWDPKENGAVLVVLWNALILHARWGGMVKERGVMVLSILGIVVTLWSFFGTNMLGIGLHSYGFMQSAQFWLTATCVAMVVIAGIGMIPLRLWASFADDRSPVERARGAFPVA